MSLYFGAIEITNIDDLVPQTGLDITDMWFGSTNVYTVWATYEGTLPATINANGDNMRQYQIYGATGGVGDVTESGEPAGYKIPISTEKPIIYGFHINPNDSNSYTAVTYLEDAVGKAPAAMGSTAFSYGAATVTPIYIGNELLDKDEYVDYRAGKVFRRTAQLFDKSKYIKTASTHQCTAAETQTGIEITSAGNDPYVGDAVGVGRDASIYKDAMIEVNPEETYTISASALPKCYISYIDDGYISLGYNQATSNPYNFITPVNCSFVLLRFGKQGVPVGETFRFDNIALLKGDTAPETYIPYLQPTDPPAPLPALPTCEGTTILDYAGSGTAPEKVLLKYRKEGY
jgi:hypothetical protein